METPLKDPSVRDNLASNGNGRQGDVAEALWQAVGTLFVWRRFILGITTAMAILAVVISLLLPNWFAASARLMAPESGGTDPLAAALSSDLSSAAAAILGGPSGDYDRYLTLLTSRTMYEAVVDAFDLVTVYETDEELDPRGAAALTLSDNSGFTVDDEFGFLSVWVMDLDPSRAAGMANYFVEELNRRNLQLASQDAGNYRRFVEGRYNEAVIELDSLKDALQAFQEEHEVYNLEQQVVSFLEQVAALSSEVIGLEIEYQALRAQYGPDNPRVRAARDAYQVAQRHSTDALEGSAPIMPVSRDSFPEVARSFLELEQNILIQKSILEIIAPMRENARFREEREYEAVQVVDAATPPTRKSWPRRSIICIAVTLSAFILACLFALAYSWWQSNASDISRRLRSASQP